MTEQSIPRGELTQDTEGDIVAAFMGASHNKPQPGNLLEIFSLLSMGQAKRTTLIDEILELEVSTTVIPDILKNCGDEFIVKQNKKLEWFPSF